MCIVHESSLHYLFQDMLEAFEKSQMLSPFFLRRVGCLICTCQNEILYDSRTLIVTQRSLFQWFETALKNESTSERLGCFKDVVAELQFHMQVDSGTKITFIRLLKDLVVYDFSMLRSLSSRPHELFFNRLVHLKFDLHYFSAKEFTELLKQMDKGALTYLARREKCSIVLRDVERMDLRHHMGETVATLECRFDSGLVKAEKALKQLVDSLHFRLVNCLLPICHPSLNDLSLLCQSPTWSSSDSSNVSSTTTSDDIWTDLSAMLSAAKSKVDEQPAYRTYADMASIMSKKMLNPSDAGTATPMTSSPISSGGNSPVLCEKKRKPNKEKKPATQLNIASLLAQIKTPHQPESTTAFDKLVTSMGLVAPQPKPTKPKTKKSYKKTNQDEPDFLAKLFKNVNMNANLCY